MSKKKKARKCISRKTKRNIEEGRPQKQSVAIAYSQCRKEGYKYPRRKLRKVI